MSEARLCTQCGQPIPMNAPEGACPHCLVELAVQMGTFSKPARKSFEVPSIQELDELPDDLEIFSLLGSGGMGAVYRGRQQRLNRPVAVKVLPRDGGRDPLFTERFLREAQALAKLNHRHIVSVYDAGQTERFLFIVMEYVDGASLRSLIQKGRLYPSEALHLVPQIAGAMQYAHDRGVVHRDIKPENILIDSDGHAKIADFGLAKLSGEDAEHDFALTEADVRMGTPRYMAPEQMGDTGKVDHRADIYSLGVVFYEMLTGALPLADYKPPSGITEVDRRVDRVVERSIKAAPEERYQKAAEVKDDLERIIASPARIWRRHFSWVVTAALIVIAGMPSLFRGELTPRRSPAGTDAWGGTAEAASPRTADQATPLPADLLQHPLVSADWEWSQPENLGPGVNTSDWDKHPAIAADELTLVFIRGNRAFQSKRTARNQPFGEAVALEGPVNAYPLDSPFLSDDGLTLWFASDRPGTRGRADIWVSHRSTLNTTFSEPENLGDEVNTEAHESNPFVSEDGLTLLYAPMYRSDYADANIYTATRRSLQELFGNPRMLPGLANGPGNDIYGRLLLGGRALVFVADTAYHSQGLRMSLRPTATADFGPPIDFESTVNTAVLSAPVLTRDAMTLYFDSNRPGGQGQFDIWTSRRILKKRPESGPAGR